MKQTLSLLFLCLWATSNAVASDQPAPTTPAWLQEEFDAYKDKIQTQLAKEYPSPASLWEYLDDLKKTSQREQATAAMRAQVTTFEDQVKKALEQVPAKIEQQDRAFTQLASQAAVTEDTIEAMETIMKNIGRMMNQADFTPPMKKYADALHSKKKSLKTASKTIAVHQATAPSKTSARTKKLSAHEAKQRKQIESLIQDFFKSESASDINSMERILNEVKAFEKSSKEDLKGTIDILTQHINKKKAELKKAQAAVEKVGSTVLGDLEQEFMMIRGEPLTAQTLQKAQEQLEIAESLPPATPSLAYVLQNMRRSIEDMKNFLKRKKEKKEQEEAAEILRSLRSGQ